MKAFEEWCKSFGFDVERNMTSYEKEMYLSCWQAALRRAAEVAVEHAKVCANMGDPEKARTAATIADLLTREAGGE